MADEQTPPKTQGRPKGTGLAKGETPIRHVRIGPLWERAEALALKEARRDSTVRRRTDRKTGETVEYGNLSAVVERALRREVERMERELGKQN